MLIAPPFGLGFHSGPSVPLSTTASTIFWGSYPPRLDDQAHVTHQLTFLSRKSFSFTQFQLFSLPGSSPGLMPNSHYSEITDSDTPPFLAFQSPPAPAPAAASTSIMTLSADGPSCSSQPAAPPHLHFLPRPAQTPCLGHIPSLLNSLKSEEYRTSFIFP